jgi:hypothetical protein
VKRILIGKFGGYPLRITDIIWKERVVEKTAEKHSVSVAEAEEALLSRPEEILCRTQITK